MADLRNKTLIVCSIVRNAEEGLRHNIPVMQCLLTRFADYRVIIYENDSTDATKQLLQAWHDSDSQRVHVSLNDNDVSPAIPTARSVPGVNPFFSRKRIARMATLRNRYLDYVDQAEWTADYLMVVDLDVDQLFEEPILSSFERDDWDAVCAFGYSTSPRLTRRYHDTYAFCEWGKENQPQTEEKIKQLADRYGTMQPKDEWVRVASAFGGVAIYRYEAVKGLRYAVYENSDSRVEVYCEHYSIYQQMRARGYDRFYVNPGMYLKYQRLTWQICRNSLKRKLETMIRIQDINLLGELSELPQLPPGKLLINTVNAHSFNTAQKDAQFAEALAKGDVLIPDGASVVWACRWLKAKSCPKERISGGDLFEFEMNKLNAKGGKVMFMGSSPKVLNLIVEKAKAVYPNLSVVTYSPPYKPEFSSEDNKAIIDAINSADPDLLWIGMTAPKQEKWTYAHWDELNIHCHVGTVGAVFDFFAGTYQRAPRWWQDHGLEWLYRLLKEPKRMWRRYLLGNPLFVWNILCEKLSAK